MKKSAAKIAILSVIAVLAGIGGGFLLRGKPQVISGEVEITSDGQAVIGVAPTDQAQIKKGDIFGSADETAFRDSAQGYLQAGGHNGEGSHTLLRPGGKSQTVYLTSSVTDLDMFVGMDVQVWGETFRGQEVGWLMDVGRLEVINPQGESPAE
jgi:hypothetical protein